MRFARPLVAAALMAALPLPLLAAGDAPLLGFAAESAKSQRDLEGRFDASLEATHLREWMKRLSARPHPVGSPFGKENAEFIAAQFRSWGYDTAIEEFQVLFPTPKLRLVEMLAPTTFKALLAEPPLKEDKTSGLVSEELPTYNAYSIDGDVTGELVYVNYGVPKDYEELARHGIDVKGKVVIARYGGSWRGIKPKVAAEHGALGCLIYSDPRDDGYFEGDVYPKGPWRSEQGAQRGSVADMPLYPGDPLTPGVGATRDAKRLTREEAKTLTRIPVMPISYGDALPLLKALAGPMAPPPWRGALPLSYHLGPGPAKVHLKLAFDWKLVPAYDVVARLPGSERPDQWIIRGNHHDAWVFGAADPLSGLVAMMEEARVVGELASSGWRPRRTLIYAAWDAEEPGLLGSTEWVETHAQELSDHAVVYINSDSNGRGFLGMAGSHTLERFINEVARDVTDPETKVSLAERERARRLLRATPEERKQLRGSGRLRIAALGSGSDYTPFLQHLGIASLNLGFGGEGGGGEYHSIYDSFDHFTRFRDPSFEYGVALAKVGGRAVLRLASADVLPLDPSALTDTVGGYVKEVVKLADDLRAEAEEENRRLDEKSYALAADPQETSALPKRKAVAPFLNFAPLQNAKARLESATGAYEQAVTKRAGRAFSPATQKALDDLLQRTERALTRPGGLPGRPWFKHQIYAPGFYTGYGVKTLPGVREALEQGDWKAAGEQIEVVAGRLEDLAGIIDQATALVATTE